MTVAVAQTDTLRRAAALLERETGMACPASRERDLARALQECCQRHGIADPETYLARSEVHPSLLDDLVGALAIGETYFFRDANQFDLLRGRILPELVREHASGPRVWSAGCASGEEPYSLAIVLADAGATAAPPVLGTDISHAALRRAEQGTYGEWSFRGVTQAIRQRSFEREGDRWRVRADIRARARFEWLNLASDAYPSVRSGIWGMDLILCRNVLIYLTADAIANVARRLHDSLAPGGWLFTSPSDPPLAELAPFETIVTNAGIVYRRSAARRASQQDEPTSLPTQVAPRAEPQPQPPRPSVSEKERSAPRVPRPADTSLDDLRSRLHALADRWEHEDLERVLAQALRAYPFEPEFQYLSALIRLEHGRDAEAAEAARRALYLDPRLAVASIALGSALRRLGDLRGARRAYRSATAVLRTYPPDAPVPLADGELAGGLLKAVDSLVALAEDAE